MGTELYPKFLSLAANWPEFWTQLGPQSIFPTAKKISDSFTSP
jgi:hypothetical protein